ncbi:hypothetical protein F5887DRAFT_925167 [Amanita rubescens]|nr:hypothetical protein F5887DRAFT_925167 [Amanita rubescens]
MGKRKRKEKEKKEKKEKEKKEKEKEKKEKEKEKKEKEKKEKEEKEKTKTRRRKEEGIEKHEVMGLCLANVEESPLLELFTLVGFMGLSSLKQTRYRYGNTRPMYYIAIE